MYTLRLKFKTPRNGVIEIKTNQSVFLLTDQSNSLLELVNGLLNFLIEGEEVVFPLVQKSDSNLGTWQIKRKEVNDSNFGEFAVWVTKVNSETLTEIHTNKIGVVSIFLNALSTFEKKYGYSKKWRDNWNFSFPHEELNLLRDKVLPFK